MRHIFVSALSLFSMVFLLVAVTFSWNSSSLNLQVSAVQLGTTGSDTLLLSVGEKSQVTSYDYQYQGCLTQVTGNGDYFYEPASVGHYSTSASDDFGNTITTTLSSIDSKNLQQKSEDELSDDVLFLPFEFQAYRPTANVYISSTSLITSATGYQENLCVSSYVEKETDRFSMDYVIGALRIGIQLGTKNEDDSISYQTKVLWIPHPEFELTYANDYYSFNSDGSIESVITFHDKKSFYSLSSSDFSQGMLTKSGITYILGNMPTLSLKQLKDGEVGLGRLVVWLEGTDRECQNPMVGYVDQQGNKVQGRFSLSFNLTL